ncbi:MAG: hypothetical protein ACFHWX_15730 [Bacteroidota bacterium]
MKSKDNSESWITYLMVIGALLVLVMPWVFTNSDFYRGIDFSNTGQIGDTIGGITAPIIGLLSAFIVFKAFQAQIKANKLFQSEREQSNLYELFNLLDQELLKIEVGNEVGIAVLRTLSNSVSDINSKKEILSSLKQSDRHSLQEEIERDITEAKFIANHTKKLAEVFQFTFLNVLKLDDEFFINMVSIKFGEEIGIIHTIHTYLDKYYGIQFENWIELYLEKRIKLLRRDITISNMMLKTRSSST